MAEPAQDNPTPAPESTPEPESPELTIVDTPEPDNAPPQHFPDNWRQLVAGEDEKELKRLERFNSVSDVFKSYRELEKQRSSFTPTPTRPGADASEDDIKAYREHYGIPETAEGYELQLEDGTVPGEDIQPFIDGYLKYAHENHVSPDDVNRNIQWYLNDVARAQEEMAERNNEAKIEGIAELKQEWGGDYKANLNAIQSLFAEAPEGVFDDIMGARDQNGLKIANKPNTIRFLVGMAKQLNPTASLLPSGATDAASIEAEIEKLTGWMTSKDPKERDKYWKDPAAHERLVKLKQAVK